MIKERTLTESYWPADTSAEYIDLTLGGLIEQVAAEIPDHVALVEANPVPEDRRRWSYSELLTESRRAAHALAAEFSPGARVGIWSPNRAEFEILQLGAAMAGIVVVMINHALKTGEVSYILEQSRAVGLFYDDHHLDGQLESIANQVAPTLPLLTSRHRFSEWNEWLDASDGTAPLPTVVSSDVAQIQYTSGTTGFPKGAVLRHGPLVTNSNVCNIRSQAELGSVFINPLPMFHVGSSTLSVIGAITRRGTHVLIPRFDPALALELVESERGNIMVMVPTVMQMLLDHPDLKTRDISSLVTIFVGGGNVPATVVERAKKGFSCNFTNGFGMTEAHGTAIQTATDDSPEDQSVSVGRALPLTEVKVGDAESGAVLPIGALGEICIRGYQTMSGYFDKPAETAATLDEQGWLHTGDLGTMDERGYVRIQSRLKDMIIRGGENVYPAEVENVIASHPHIANVQVIGIDDERWGEQVAAVITLVDGVEPDGEALYQYCRERLAGFKAPRIWYRTTSYPLTASGKIQKFVLRNSAHAGELELVWKAPER